MSSKEGRKRFFIGGAIATLLAVATVGGLVVRQAWGEGDGNLGTGEEAQGGSCADPTKTTYWDTCYGATWRYYTDLDSEGYKRASAMESSANAPAVDIGPCREETTTTTGNATTTSYKVWSGYFRLGLQKYNPSIYYKTDNAQAAYLDGQVGVNQNGELCLVRNVSPPGCVRFKVVGGSLSLEDTSGFYTIAASHAKAIPEGATWEEDLGWFCYDESWGSAPTGSTTPTPPGGGEGDTVGEFVSRSTVLSRSTDNPGVQPAITNHDVTSPDDGTATLYLSTDGEQFTGRFYHNIEYKQPNASGTFDSVIVNWQTKYKVGNDKEIDVASGTISKIPGGSGFTSENLSVREGHPVTVQLAKGQTVTVCETIYYNLKYQYFHFDNLGYAWTGSSDSGSSTACYKVTRPADPEDDDPQSDSEGKSTGEAESGVKFAGERSGVGWRNVKATNYATRRVAEMQEIVYAIPTSRARNEGKNFTGNRTDNNRTTIDPCSYYKINTGQQTRWADGAGCAVLGNSTYATSKNTGTDTNKGTLVRGYKTENGGYIKDAMLSKVATKINTSNNEYPSQNRRDDVVVPDYVGYKYCNAIGWKYTYYWGAETKDKSGHGQVTWAPEGGKYNWITHDAACRTISKKPSVSVWNGSVMSNGGAKTSLSHRYDATSILTPAIISEGGQQRDFGSWSEYLAVFGKTVSGLTSGSSLSLGNKYGDIWSLYSPLTVANITSATGSFDSKNQLGNSGVTSNTTLRTRLNTFLRDRAEAVKVNCSDGCNSVDVLGLGDTERVTGHRIFNVTGDLYIDKNIKLNTGNYASIYDLPQVVIFVSGNVTIDPNVTQIDAWLIVGDAGNSSNGEINTCSGFSWGVGGTDADAWTQSGNSLDGICRKQLVFNGPVIANRLQLNRSYGSDNIVKRSDAYSGSLRNNALFGQANQPSYKYSAGEIFNYRTDSYLWAYAQAGRYDSSYTETYSRELAPRY